MASLDAGGRAMPMLWHVSMFLGLRYVRGFPPYLSFLIIGFYFFFLSGVNFL
jgi:hypothetical protein